MNHSTAPTPAARADFLAGIAARRAIGTNMARAILSGTDAVVEVTLGRAGHYIVSGSAAAVAAAAPVLALAGLTLDNVDVDDDGTAYADWMSS